MKIEVWSDMMCPFCYIGKKHLDAALKKFSESDAIVLEWKSFQLDPDIPHSPAYENVYHYLAERKGVSYEQAEEMTAGVAQMGARAGVTLNFGQSVVANSFNAHRLIHMAQAKGQGSALKERLFRAHFTDGQDINDRSILIALGKAIGLDESAIVAVLDSDQYSGDVLRDIQEAQRIGVRGVPFFVFNRKYALSGAQPPEVFLQALEKSVAEWRAENLVVPLSVTEGPSCGPDGICD